MAINFQRMEKTAQRLISDNGALVTVSKITKQKREPSKPWGGPPQKNASRMEEAVKADGTVDKKTGKGVLYNADERTADGVNILRGDVVVMVSAKDFDYRSDWDTLTIGKTHYQIERVRTIHGSQDTDGDEELDAPLPIVFDFVVTR